ncbi:hypothetical protein Tco_0961520, partial [Tanacetum coccineum]
EGWTSPQYSSVKEGQDHCPFFRATVVVDGSRIEKTTPRKTKTRSRKDELWIRKGEVENKFSSTMYSRLKVSLWDIFSLDDMKERMATYLSLTTCKEILDAMTHVTKTRSSIPTFPPQTLLSSLPDQICLMHESLINAKVMPSNDVYNHLSSTNLQKSRFNLRTKKDKDKGGYVAYTKRDLAGRKTFEYLKIGNSSAKWVEKTTSVKICGNDETGVGTHQKLLLVFSLGKGEEVIVSGH